MIGSLLYLIASRPKLIFSYIYMLNFNIALKNQFNAFQIIFRYLKSKSILELWYPKIGGIDQISYSDANFIDYKIDYKSTNETY